MSLAEQFLIFADKLIGEEYTWGDEPWFSAGGASTEDPYDTDCSGLVFGIFRKLGILWSNGAIFPRLTANGYYHSSTPVSESDLKVGDIACFVDSKNHCYHIGVVLGKQEDGKVWVEEARGKKYGVVKYAIDDPTNGAIHRGAKFMRFVWVDLGITAPIPPVTEPTPLPDYPNLRKGMYNNKYVKIAQTKLISKGYKCGPTGADGDFGRDTLVAVEKFQRKNKDLNGIQLVIDGIIGPKTWGVLLK